MMNYLNEEIKFLPPEDEDVFGLPSGNAEPIYVKGHAKVKTKYQLNSNNEEQSIKELSILVSPTEIVDKKWRIEYQDKIYVINQVDFEKHPMSGRIIHKVVKAT